MRIIPRRNIVYYKGELKDIIGLIIRGKIKAGPHIRQFEEQFAQYIGTKHAIAVASGRLGLFLILEALSLNRNDEVILPAYTDESVPAVIQGLGLTPIFIDIERDTHNIDTNLIEGKINFRTKVILATHIFGRPCNLRKVAEIAQKHKLFVIEDCAHAIGAEYAGKRVGSFGTAAYYSFGITKPFSTFGGGMITTNDTELCVRITKKVSRMPYPGVFTLSKNAIIYFCLLLATARPIFSFTIFPLLLFLSNFNKDLINVYNKTVKQAVRPGQRTVKYTNIQALMGIKQLKSIDAENEMRRRNAALLRDRLNSNIEILRDGDDIRPTYYFFVVMTHNVSSISKKLLRKGIDTGKHIMRDCSQIYRKDLRCTSVQEAIETSLQIPNYPRLTGADMEYISGILMQEFKFRDEG
ncbi:MAG: DegT/DnrJ/EryC1/StrS family aminotransferase [Deltaproteobacteria bacterium]